MREEVDRIRVPGEGNCREDNVASEGGCDAKPEQEIWAYFFQLEDFKSSNRRLVSASV